MSLKPYLIEHILEETAQRLPDKVAVKQGDRTVTFGALLEDARKMKGLLTGLGVKPGDRVGIFLDKSIEQLLAMFAVSMAGGGFVFINPVLKKDQIEYIANDCQVGLLITTDELRADAHLDAPLRFLYLDEAPADVIHPCWPRLRGTLKPDLGKIARIADDIACLIYTSGSTGMPKGVVIPHRTVVEGAEIVSSYLGITEQDRIISVLPFNFDYGLNQATTSILHGATLVLHQFVLPGDLLAVLQKEEITGFAGMPPIWVKLFNDKFHLKEGTTFPHLRYITNSGGKVPRVLVERMRAGFPTTRIFLMYGLTEAFRSTFLSPEELEQRPDSIGKAIPNVEILVVNAKGEECAPGVPGELVHRGALITRGYWNDPERTKKIFRKNPQLAHQEHLHETVVFSGDEVKRDEDGFLYFISRRDEMIKTSGYRVSPTEVEEVIIGIPIVSNVVVFGKELETGEQIIVAVVETDADTDEKPGLIRECRKRLPGYMVPQEINFEKVFHKTANGKIDRSGIKKKWLAAGHE
jgi:acyl-CoA ligase (AMP-forming) (exosortase A-associated)